MEGNMNLFRAIPLILACSITLPLAAQGSDDRERYTPPESIGKSLTINSSTQNTTTFRFLVKSLIGKAENVKLTAKVIGDEELTPVPSSLEVKELSERKNTYLDFVIPVTKEQINSQKFKIQCNVEYLPDYAEIIKHVEKDTEHYKNQVAKEHLINMLKKNSEKSVTSNQALRYIPPQK